MTTRTTAPSRVQVDRDTVVKAAVDLLYQEGYQALTMRRVASRLGVSPIPLYTRVGDKNALIEAVADRLLGDIEVSTPTGGSWTDQAEQWAHEYRDRLKAIPDRHLLLNNQRRDVLVRCARPLLMALRSTGLTRAQAVRVCRMLMWTTNGFVVIESGVERVDGDFESPETTSLPAGRPDGVTQSDIENLFASQIRFLVEGLRGEISQGATRAPGRRRTPQPSGPERRR